MKTKVVKNFIYDGLGFPIHLVEVIMMEYDNEWHPKIDVEQIALAAIQKLIMQPDRFTGNQIKFIRHYLSMTLRDFAKKVVHESHTAVSKWERYGNDVTHMDVNIEKMLRLYMDARINANTVEQKQDFFSRYKIVENLAFTQQLAPFCLEM
jgi:DNA-binding transcriptional regulator YiaG